MAVGFPLISCEIGRPLGGQPVMPKWAWPTARNRPGRPVASPSIGRLSGVQGLKPIQKRWPSVFTSGNIVRTLASKALARRSSGAASRPAISTVPATLSPCSIGVTPNGRCQRNVGRRQHDVVTALGLERHADAKRLEQANRARAGCGGGRSRREPLRAIDHSEQYLSALFGGQCLKAVEPLCVMI